MIIWAMVYIREVINSVQSIHASQFPVTYLIVRFLATFLAQVFLFLVFLLFLFFAKINFLLPNQKKIKKLTENSYIV